MSSRDLRSTGVFIALAVALSWLVALPLWFGGGLADPWFPVVSVAMMTTPAIAALVVVRFVERPQRMTWTLGLWPLRPARRVLGWAGLGIGVSIALVLVALPVGALLGVYPADFTGFSAFRQLLDERTGSAELPMPVGALIAVQLALIPLAALLNLVPALGEELGWRGWLLPKLMPLGPLPALLITGVIWGGWHAPLILLGYNYPDAPGWLGVTAMIGMCILVGAVFGWLRLRSGSVWPAALAHAAFNAAAGSYLLFAEAGEHVDTTQATILGWSGWIVPLVLVVILVGTGRFAPAERPPGPPDPVDR
ncbi:CPBP family intramembrane metalloprotease [Saccharopolyspora sp. NFXS83]|uniref:CPBP family intramembrane glutamic endopeptidase n=1 Tax=Saccharopolyspora sp. NFXS83 TaxID=2993560 RepID=UPI00224B86BD|nr:CPBP family intramembrane glutamic endopeptidase [Saccharopolyspora sp. NFXS83]MCX2730100.1 CPBP family intramembrane metalloprotease [Saccharopolyspora sp. NFXS83]